MEAQNDYKIDPLLGFENGRVARSMLLLSAIENISVLSNILNNFVFCTNRNDCNSSRNGIS